MAKDYLDGDYCEISIVEDASGVPVVIHDEANRISNILYCSSAQECPEFTGLAPAPKGNIDIPTQ